MVPEETRDQGRYELMPRPPRFFVSPDRVTGSRISLADEDARHVAMVLRMQRGDMLTVCDGTGKEYSARIAEVTRSAIAAEIESQRFHTPSSPRVLLGQGLPKSDKMDWVVQKATELGVAEIVPLLTERTVARPHAGVKRLDRWQKIAREAAMQSSRCDIPQVREPQHLTGFFESCTAGPATLLLMPWEEETMPLKEVLREPRGVQEITILIGPEGGFSRTEAEAARRQGFRLVSLGPNILRAETAAVATLSMVQYACR